MDGGSEHAEPPLSEFASGPYWVTWRSDPAGRKRPVQRVKSGAVVPASTGAQGTWRHREAAELLADELCAAGDHAGVGLVAHLRGSGERVVLIDLDAAIDPTTGAFKGWVEPILDRFATYTEVSPSGLGLHIVFRLPAADLPAVEALLRQGREIQAGRKWFRKAPKGQKAEGIELIWRGYATFTGKRLLDHPRDVRVVHADAVGWLFGFARSFKVTAEDVLPDGTAHLLPHPSGASAHATSTAAPVVANSFATPQFSEPTAVLDAGTQASVIAPKQQPGRRMEWDAAYIADLTARRDDAEFAVAAAYATVGFSTRDGLAEAGLPLVRLVALTGRQHGRGSSPKTITGAKERLVGKEAVFIKIKPAITPNFGRAGSVERYAFKAWWSPGCDKTRTARVILEFDLWEELLRGGKVRRRSLRIIAHVLSKLAIDGHHPSAILVPRTCLLARALTVEPGDVVRALDDAVKVGLFDMIEPRRRGRAASYMLSPRGAARWPTPRLQAG